MKVVADSFEGVEDPDEQLMLALVAHIAPSLESWQAGEDLREEQMLLGQKLPTLKKALDKLEAEGRELALRVAGVVRDPLFLGTTIGGAVLVVVAFAFSKSLLAWPGLAALGYGIYRFLQARSELAKLIAAKEGECQAKSAEVRLAESRLVEIDRELSQRDGGFPETTVARMAFPMKVVNVVGREVLLDLSGTSPPVQLSTVDLSAVGADVGRIAGDAQRMASVPILLDPRSGMQERDPVDRLYGQEDELREQVDAYVGALGKVQDVSISLPLVAANSALVSRMSQPIRAESTAGAFRIQGEVSDLGRIASFVKQVNQSRNEGQSVLRLLKETHQSLSAACESYSAARLSSINVLHQAMYDVLNRASWCSKRFYCPRSIGSANYLHELLDIDPADAHELPFEELVDRLQADPVIARRILDRPELLDALYMAHRALAQDFGPMTAPGEIADSASGAPMGGARAQLEENLKQFRLSLTKVLTGASAPMLDMSESSRLYYDPDLEEWRSSGAPYAYTTAQVQRHGQILKVYSDLLMPLWEHLWTEKADFRKSETFRTNEALIRMTEKEAEKLIEIGNQFRADMRHVRENVNVIESDLQAKLDEIRQFRDSMKRVGLLSERQEGSLSDEVLTSLALGDESVLKRGEEVESWLGAEPKAQAERRGTIRDPVDIPRSPEALLPYGLTGASRRLSLREEA